MLDLISIFNLIPNIDVDTTSINNMVGDFVPYYVRGENRFSYGLSFYYPLLYDVGEIRNYNDLRINNNYNNFLKDFYLNIPETTIEFKDKGSVNNNGLFQVSLTPNSSLYLSSVDYIITSTDEAGKKHIILTDNNITIDQENLTYQSNYNGKQFSLDGHPMYSVTTSRSEDDASFSTPVILNGKRTTLVFDYMNFYEEDIDDYYAIIGTWDSYDENGLPSNAINPLKKGDKIQVLKDLIINGDKIIENYSEEFVINDENVRVT